MSTGMRRIIIFIGLVTWLTGCGAGAEPKSKVKSYPPDGYLGMTSVNPNQPLNPTYHHYSDDTNLMKAVLAQIPGIVDSRISLLGPHANVKLRLEDGISPTEADQIRSDAQMALVTNMPRYRIDVSIEQK
ncbi:hypothetical protein D3C73_463670 [compost metagenome]